MMIRFFPSGDSAFLVKFGDEISLDIHQKIKAYVSKLKHLNIPGVLEIIPAYTDVTVLYDPLEIPYQTFLEKLKQLATNLDEKTNPGSRKVKIPVLYGEPFGEDLSSVVKHTGLSPDEIVKLHSSGNYLVYMLGFTPGFCYLGGMDERIACPRKDVPSQKILAGAVGIAGKQTGIYPIESPGGWQIIGRTPLKLFDPQKDDPFLLKAGDELEFFPITKKEFDEINEYK